MGVSIQKVTEEKLHKQNKPKCRLATATIERLCEEAIKYPNLSYCSMEEYKDVYIGFNS